MAEPLTESANPTKLVSSRFVMRRLPGGGLAFRTRGGWAAIVLLSIGLLFAGLGVWWLTHPEMRTDRLRTIRNHGKGDTSIERPWQAITVGSAMSAITLYFWAFAPRTVLNADGARHSHAFRWRAKRIPHERCRGVVMVATGNRYDSVKIELDHGEIARMYICTAVNHKEAEQIAAEIQRVTNLPVTGTFSQEYADVLAAKTSGSKQT